MTCSPQKMEHVILMMTSSNGNIFRVTSPLCREFTDHRWPPPPHPPPPPPPPPTHTHTQRPVTRSFDVFFEMRLNKRLSKQGWWVRRRRSHYDATVMEENPLLKLIHSSSYVWLTDGCAANRSEPRSSCNLRNLRRVSSGYPILLKAPGCEMPR